MRNITGISYNISTQYVKIPFKILQDEVHIYCNRSRRWITRHEIYQDLFLSMSKVNYMTNRITLDEASTCRFLKYISKYKKLTAAEEKLLKKYSKYKIRIYAAGAIEECPDHGVSSRKIFKDIFRNTNCEIVNPCDFEFNQKKYPTMHSFQKDHSVSETYIYARNIVDKDLKAVASCDVLTIYLDENCGVGTTSEASVAYHIGMPIYAIQSQGCDLNNVQPWLLSLPNQFFKDFNEFREFTLR